ncbi:MAG: ABC transporter permease [Lachnospiraceae bacterium]|nr:ABC transporter permease [Lachnospiraceae bacterium]
MTKRKMYFRMITASLMRRRSRMLVALLAIAIGATILSGLVTIYYDVPRQMGAQFRNYGANMILTAVDGSFTKEDMDAGLAIVASEDFVGATPFRYETVRIHEQPIMAAGTDLEAVKKTSPYWLIDGEWPAESGEILVGENVAENLNLKIGSTVTLSYTPETGTDVVSAVGGEAVDTQNGGVAQVAGNDAALESNTTDEEVVLDNTIDFVVKGTLNTGGSEEDYVYVSMTDLEALTGIIGEIDVAEVSISASGDGLNAYMEHINGQVPAVHARLVKRVTASETTVLSKLQALVLLVTVVVLALTMICVATTMTAVVTERRREIGLRKAIGASDVSIIQEFMGEGMLLGGVGGILGSGLGFAFAQFVSVNVFSSTITLRPVLVPVTIIVSIVITGIACLLPIKSATKVDPALVLKGE